LAGIFTGRMSFLSQNQQRQSTEWNTKQSPQLVACTHHFCIHHLTPDESDVVPFMLDWLT